MLKTKDVTIQFGGLTALSKLNIEVEENQIVGLIGPNGAGKTTAFNVITGVYKPTSGKVYFEENDISGKKPNEITKCGIARTFQNIRLFKDLTVLENIQIAEHLRIKSSLPSAILGFSSYKNEEKEMHERAISLLEEVGLLDNIKDKASSLPYGKQRKLEIARALATRPKLLLLDEPAAGMNQSETMQFISFIEELKRKHNISVLMIEHHMQLVMGICEKIWVLDYGKEIAKGLPKEVQGNKAVIEAYLGVD